MIKKNEKQVFILDAEDLKKVYSYQLALEGNTYWMYDDKIVIANRDAYPHEAIDLDTAAEHMLKGKKTIIYSDEITERFQSVKTIKEACEFLDFLTLGDLFDAVYFLALKNDWYINFEINEGKPNSKKIWLYDHSAGEAMIEDENRKGHFICIKIHIDDNLLPMEQKANMGKDEHMLESIIG